MEFHKTEEMDRPISHSSSYLVDFTSREVDGCSVSAGQFTSTVAKSASSLRTVHFFQRSKV